MRLRVACIVSLICAPVMFAQSSQLTGPISGYVFDRSSRGLRPILGIPGASTVGAPINFGGNAAAAWVAPRQDAAFVTASDGTFHLFRIQSGTATESVLNGLIEAPEQAVFSPTGTAAALYRAGSIQTVRGLPDAPAIAGMVNASALGAPNSLAVSDDGTVLLAAAGNAVELFISGGDLGPLTATAGGALVAFAPGQNDAAVVDPRGAGLVLFHDLTGGMQRQVVAEPDAAIQSAVALAFSTDGQRLLLASATGRNVTAFDLASGGRSSVACSCAPTILERTGDRFRLNEFGTEPLWLLDARTSTPTLVFVPAAGQPVRRPPLRTGIPRRPTGPSQSAPE